MIMHGFQKMKSESGKLQVLFSAFGNFYSVASHFWVGLFRCGQRTKEIGIRQSVGCINLYPLEICCHAILYGSLLPLFSLLPR